MGEVNENHQQYQNSQEQRQQMARAMYATKTMFGRTVILTSKDITDDNVVSIVSQAYKTHLKNREEIEYLWRYYKGDQPSIHRTREVRDELTAHIVENRANEIVTFKTGYLVGKPIKYVAADGAEDVSKSVTKLNKAMRIVGKKTKDKKLVDVMNLKLDTFGADRIMSVPGIFPAYHMNHKLWISVLLDDTLSDEEVMILVDDSFRLTGL